MTCSEVSGGVIGALALAITFPVVQSPVFADDDMEAPVIHEQTLSEYVNAGDSNWEMKLRMSAYLEALLSELDSLSIEVGSEMLLLPDPVLEEFTASHEAFLSCAGSWAQVQEDVQWFDLSTGELYLGSGYGYTYTWHMCDMVWDRMQSYMGILEEIRGPDFDGYVSYPGEGSHEVGGY